MGNQNSFFFVKGFILPLVFLFFLFSSASAQLNPKGSLIITIPGINDSPGGAAPEKAWVGNAGLISPAKKRYIIRRKTKIDKGWFYNALNSKGSGNKVPKDARTMETVVIEIDDPDDALRELRRIAGQKNVSVIIDMDIGYELWGKGAWKNETEWAGKIAVILADEYLKKYPDAETTLIGHSAGTQAMVEAQNLAKNFLEEPGNIENINQKKLFKRSIAMSPMDWEHLSKDTTLVISDRDLPPVPYGSLFPVSVAKSWWGRTAKNLQNDGREVIRVATESRAILPVGPFKAHSFTADLSYPDQNIIYYDSKGGPPVILKGTSISKVINTLQEIDKASNNTPGSYSGSKSRTEILAEKISRDKPNDLSGGITINPTAVVPINPDEVKSASFDVINKRLYLDRKNKPWLYFPRIDGEVLKLAYDSVYGVNEKPELSIGLSYIETLNGKGVRLLNPPGYYSVHYLDKSEGTFLGLVMYLADEALAAIAFGEGAGAKEITEKVPGFHALSDLYPEKYTKHPKQEEYVSEQRVFLQTTLVEFRLGSDKYYLENGDVRFRVSFSDMGSAEQYFASMFSENFDEIIETEVGKPLADLIPFARAVGIFRWLKKNNIRFIRWGLANSLSNMPLTRVYTPHSAKVLPFLTLEDVNPTLPIVFFGRYGPTQKIGQNGEVTEFFYTNGKPIKIERPDGTKIEILRDDLGKPLAIRIEGLGEAAFFTDPELGHVFAENIRIIETGGNISIEMGSETILYPDNQPEKIINSIIQAFLIGD